MSSNKVPPLLSKSSLYSDWKKKVKIWADFTTLEKKKHGAAVLLTLEGSAEEAVLELDLEVINSNAGLDRVIEKLDKLYLKDTTLEKFEALEKFDTYKRNAETSIQEHIHQFDKLYYKLHSHGTTISEDLLAYKLLKSANLSKTDEKLAKGTVTELNLANVKAQLKKIFPDKESLSGSASSSLTLHDINEATCEENTEHYTYFAGKQSTPGNRRYSPSPRRFQNNQQAPRNYQQAPRNYPTPSGSDNRNPRTRDGTTSRCRICESIFHWAADCPDRRRFEHQRPVRPTVSAPSRYVYYQEQPSYSTNDDDEEGFTADGAAYHEIVLFQSDYDHPKQLPGLVAESWNAAVLDSGATKTVCGRNWFKSFMESLPDDASPITPVPVSNLYRFGDGNQVEAKENVVLPATLGTKMVGISTDIVDRDIPLLLSRSTMKRAGMSIDFKTDTASVFGVPLKLNVTRSGHYTLPITAPTQLLASMKTDDPTRLVLTVQKEKSKHAQALKLHRQFAHAPADKLVKLLKTAGEPWNSDVELEAEIRDISKTCQTCLQYGKAAAKPVVGLPMANEFLETVAMDLKFYQQKIILHLIDHATRLSSCVRIPSKEPKHVIKAIFSHWISIYGTTEKFLTDNGGEFVNNDFLDMCEQLNITVKTTGAESPWSNGLVERNNQTISNMLDKVLDDTACDFDIALAWCVNAKNSLENCHGFSPYQLAIGRNPRLPSSSNSSLPALTADRSPCEILRHNLNALHSAREAFMESERSQKLKRALAHNTRSYSDQVILNGDIVFYKRNGQTRWRGPATVLGKDGQQVLLKHGGFYVRVHPCCIRQSRDEASAVVKNENVNPSNSNPDRPTLKDATSQESTMVDTESDSEDNGDSPTAVPVPTPPPTPHSSNQTQALENRPVIVPPDFSIIKQPTPASDKSLKIPATKNFRQKDRIAFRFKDGSQFIQGTVHSRSGKATGKYKDSWNIVMPDGKIKSVDFSTDVIEWNRCPDSSDCEILRNDTMIAEVDREAKRAIAIELQSWKDKAVYEEVPDEGQSCIALRWVLTPKVIDGRPSTKARLVAKGFQETQDFRTDSPTCSRESIRLLIAIAVMMEWPLESIDIHAAFLQGSGIDREIFVKPPTEANTKNLWKLQKCVYGLADAPRQFYLRLRKELLNLKVTPSTFDNGLFFWMFDGKLCGILVCHVDDLLYAGGTPEFVKHVIIPLDAVLKFGRHNRKAFKYVGIDLQQLDDNSIVLSQHSFAASIQKIQIPKDADQHAPVTDEMRTDLRSVIGQLNWLACISRPEISFDVSYFSGKVKDATVADVYQVNKVVTKVQNNPSFIHFPKLDPNSLHLRTYADGSFNSLSNGGSQGGQLVLLCDRYDRCCPLGWNSTRLKRVVRSALAAETLSMCDGCELSFFIAAMAKEILNSQIPLYVVTDSRSLYEALGSTKQLTDKRLRLEVYALREMVEEGDIKVMWVEGSKQLSDTLTKRGTSWKLLVEVLQNGELPCYSA